MQDKQKAQQERVYELSEEVAELEDRQQSLKRALDAYRQVNVFCALVARLLHCHVQALLLNLLPQAQLLLHDAALH